MTAKAIRHYPVTSTVLKQVEVFAGNISKADRRFFCHLLADSLRRGKRLQRETVPGFKGGGWIPMRRRMIDDAFYVGKGTERQRTNPKRLKELGLIEMYERYQPGVTASKYRVASHVMEALELVSLSEVIHTTQPLFDLMSGLPWKEKWNVSHTPIGQEASSDTPADPDSPPPRLVERAMDMIRECHYNRDALTKHLEKCRIEYHQAMAAGNLSHANYLRRRLINDVAIFRELPPHSPFRPAYRPQTSGRIGTPMQNLTGESKAATYGGIPGLQNYDLASSQLRICRYYEFPRYGVECPWLNDFLDDSDLRFSYAAAIGITSEAFKEAVIGVLMGSRLPRDATDTAASILHALQEGLLAANPCAAQGEVLDGVVTRFNEMIAPLKKALNLWHNAIMQRLEKEGTIFNALNLPITLAQVKNHSGGSKRGTVAAHILQGTEARFIHCVTSLADSHGFQVMGNEHDGLVTIGAISPAAICETQRLTGLDCLELREKPFS